MESILLIIICILLVSDVYLLYKLFMSSKKGKEVLSNKQYYELKYNINLLKAISAIAVFVIGFFGYSTYSDFSNKITSDINNSLEAQDSAIINLNNRLLKMKYSIDTLEAIKRNLETTLTVYNSNMHDITNKVSLINESLKSNPKIFIVKKLFEFSNQDFGIKHKVYFSDIKTIADEKLPLFKEIPIVNIESNALDLFISKVTTEYVEFVFNNDMIDYMEIGKNFKKGFQINLWIAIN